MCYAKSKSTNHATILNSYFSALFTRTLALAVCTPDQLLLTRSLQAQGTREQLALGQYLRMDRIHKMELGIDGGGGCDRIAPAQPHKRAPDDHRTLEVPDRTDHMLGVEPDARKFAHVEEGHKIPNVLVHMAAAGVQSNQPVHMPVGVQSNQPVHMPAGVQSNPPVHMPAGVVRKKVGVERMKVGVERMKVAVGVRKKVACKIWRELHTMVAWGRTSL